MGYVYYLKIINIEYKNKDIVLYIHITPTGAGDSNYFPESENLKRFFFMSLNSIYLDYYPKRLELGLNLSINQKPKDSFDIYKKIEDFKEIYPFYNFNKEKVEDLMKKDNWVEWYNRNSYKFVKNVKIYKISYQKLIELLKLNDFQREFDDAKDKIIRKRCPYCKKLFKYKDNISIEKLISRAKNVLNTEDRQLLILYLKNKVGINILNFPDVDNNFYDWGEQCREHYFFEYPEEVIYYCYSIRCCSSVCALQDVLKKSKEEIFDGNDIIHTYSGVEYKVTLDKNNVNVEIFERIKNITFGTTGF